MFLNKLFLKQFHSAVKKRYNNNNYKEFFLRLISRIIPHKPKKKRFIRFWDKSIYIMQAK